MEAEAFTKDLIENASQMGVSDIHILPDLSEYQVYFRQNGILEKYSRLSIIHADRLLTYLKYLSNLDVGEKRRPQTGSITLSFGQNLQDLRLSTISDYSGKESMVIRLLAQAETDHLLNCSFFQTELLKIKRLVKYQSGLVLFSGPVNSGKTTTMYSLLRERINQQPLQVISIEDPVEIHEPKFLQAQVNEKSGITYESLLKASLRHHPDIILVGEIRDEETAQMVIRGALTGHLILASVHAKNGLGVLSRLEELGISRELLQQTIIGIVFQKLIPRYCPLCQKTCGAHCQHLDKDHKRLALYEVLQTKEISRFYQNNIAPANHRHFNQLLEKVWAYGFISEEIYEQYFIP